MAVSHNHPYISSSGMADAMIFYCYLCRDGCVKHSHLCHGSCFKLCQPVMSFLPMSNLLAFFYMTFNNWVSLSKPHIDHDNGPHAWNNDMYLYMYVSFTLHLSHFGSRDPCMPLKCSMYFRKLTCSHAFTINDWSYSCLPSRLYGR